MVPRPFLTTASRTSAGCLAALVVPAVLAALAASLSACGHEGPSQRPHDEQGSPGAHAKTEPFVYVALGDSTGAGVGAEAGKGYVDRIFAHLVEARPGSRLVNLSVSGATTADVLRVQLQPMREAHATLATLGVGVNDLRGGVPLEQFAINYDQIVASLVESVDGPVILQNLPDGSLAPVVPASYRDTVHRKALFLNERISTVARLHAVPLVDLFTTSEVEAPGHPELFSADGFHPSELGYARWADAVWPAVQGAAGI